MKVNIFAFLVSLILSFSLTSIYFREIRAESEILGEEAQIKKEATPTSTPTPSPSVTPTPSPTPTPSGPEALRAGGSSPSPTLTPTPASVPQPQFNSEQIHHFIERFAAQYSVDPNVLRHIAVCESGFNPLAINGPYVGLYQFTAITWKNKRLAMGEDTNPDMRLNAEEAVQTAAFALSINQGYIWPSCVP